MVGERELQIKLQLHQIVSKLDEENKRIYEDYLYMRGHLDRLIHMVDTVLPYCRPDTHLVDLGSNVVFPYLIKSLAKVQACDGLSRSYHHGEIVVIREDYSIAYEPLNDFPYDISRIESTSIAIPMVHCDLSKDRLPYRNGTIDLITCFETIEHLRSDPMNLLAEANRIIRDDGIFVLTTPNANSLSNMKRMLRYESPNFYPPFIRDLDMIEHVKEYSIQEMRLMFESAGFEIIDLDTFDHVNSQTFNHYEAYQIGYARADEAQREQLRRQDEVVGRHMANLFAKFDGLDRYRGDYMQVTARKASGVKDRYCFPLYEQE
ncbi:class I SAM-dependent methyltransferase [Paenibacillus filicis]|uniref:Class I SAM-dependent methyltransferase n=1 Tax=Paenibacillus filicis TaxID=669464 RepID=A0ABU9DEN7_9BACL